MAGLAAGDVDIDLDENTVDAQNGIGVLGLSFGTGDVDIEGEGSTVDAEIGFLGVATAGNVWIDSGDVTANGLGGGSVGVVGAALAGNVDIDTHGNTTAEGLIGVGGFASGDVDIGTRRCADSRSTPRTASVCSAVCLRHRRRRYRHGRSPTVDATMGITALALNGNATIESGRVIADGGGLLSTGVVAIANNGNATVTGHGTISSDGGLFGAAAISTNGSATVNVEGITIDPPVLGASAIVLGGSLDATVNGNNSTIDATGVGGLAFNLGSGDANVNAEDATIGVGTAPALGIGAFAFGGGDADIEADGSYVEADTGIVGMAINGDVYIDSGEVRRNRHPDPRRHRRGRYRDQRRRRHRHRMVLPTANGLFGVLGTAINGDVDIDTGDDVTAVNGAGVNAHRDQRRRDGRYPGRRHQSRPSWALAAWQSAATSKSTPTIVHTTASGFQGSGVVGIALDTGPFTGSVNIDTNDTVTAVERPVRRRSAWRSAVTP